MRLLEKLIREGWWDRSRRPEIKIDITYLSDLDVEQLWRTKVVGVQDRPSGKTYVIKIPSSTAPEDLTEDDFEIIDLDGVVHVGSNADFIDAAQSGTFFMGGRL